jgi:hypothetical protein
MKITCSCIAIVMLLACIDAPAAEPPEFVSATYQDILARVVERDKSTGAILTVKARSDSLGARLHFSIEEARPEDEVVVVLSWNNKINDGVYEKYRLRTDRALRDELAKQKAYMREATVRGQQAREEQARAVDLATGGRLQMGMPQGDVERIQGKPLRIEHGLVAAALSDDAIWVYPELRLHFSGGMLRGAQSIGR